MGALQLPESLPSTFDRRVAQLAASQHGVFSRDQAVALGATKAMIRSRVGAGRWDDRFRNVFQLGGASPSWHQSLMSVILFWGDGSAASHRGAVGVWELSSCKRLPELTVPRTRQRSGEVPGIVHRHELPEAEVVRRDGIPVTTVTRTLIDLAGSVTADVLEETLDEVLRRVTSRGATSRRTPRGASRPCGAFCMTNRRLGP